MDTSKLRGKREQALEGYVINIAICTGPQMILEPQMFPGPELIPLQKIRNGVASMKSLWMDTYSLNYPR